MNTLTKEWLLKTIAELEEERDAVPGIVNEDAAMSLAAMKIALASLEAEAVCVIDQSNLDYLKSGSDADVWPASRAEMGDVLLYRSATPAPVSVPDEVNVLLNHLEDVLPDDAFNLIDVKTWNNVSMLSRPDVYRAAMLQGAERTNYRAIVERIAEIIHGKVTDIDLLTVTVKSMKDKLQK
ncbi:hypothetical protein [Enterobacter hormaechei]|uniref:hypothetical protein n=1 Tax=Enterobacter hormaechei TaxID=158836 RepID=UPI00069EF868|nr:hypothetical protein [Enterobacter hormaechei]MBJ6453412.1 hypothetical protein [Enterobacter hormaechei]MEA3929177.1 hypothetical protein [Enterobacter hormaechei]MEC5614160.1 hypothetical protein [Enterobacter hormaechei]QLW00246.1 hypothetical protein HV129_10185 [Enterobacter hormaechei]CZZ12997.1 Uncharacterised protein [Enterobacter hormaechei]